jgi:hypothetical protein
LIGGRVAADLERGEQLGAVNVARRRRVFALASREQKERAEQPH